jgi:hypothetical protein
MRTNTIVSVALGIVVIIGIMVWQDNRITRVTDSVDRLVDKLDRLIEEMNVSEPGQQYAEWWSGSPPQKYSVTTTFQDSGHENETRTDWENRHNAAVYALKLQHPPV